MVPLAGDGPWSQALGPSHFSWMFLDETPKGLPRVTLPDVWFVYRTNPGDLVLGHGRRRREDGALSVRGGLRLHARRDEPLRRRAAAGRHRPRKPAADAHRRHRSTSSSSGTTRASRCASRPSPRAARRATSPTIATELAQRTGLLGEIHRRDQQGRRRRAAQGRAWRLLARHGRSVHAARDLGRGLPRRERRAERRRRVRTVSTGGRNTASRPSRFPASDWYLFPTMVERGLRFELPYQERLRARRRRTRPAPARERHALVGRAARGIPDAARRARISARRGRTAVVVKPAASRRTIRSGC